MAARVSQFLRSNDDSVLRGFLEENSGLPGPRGNLELADAFARAVRTSELAVRTRLWSLCEGLAAISAEAAPVGNPAEFSAFCGVRGLGALAATSPALARRAMSHMRRHARDSRWRLREAVAMAIQDALPAQPKIVALALRAWVRAGDPLEMRAVAAGLADPPILRDSSTAKEALALHRQIVGALRKRADRTSEAFRVLRQGLGFTVSVVVAAAPGDGFRWLSELAATDDPDVRWIVRENLKKNRLVRAFPREVKAIAAKVG